MKDNQFYSNLPQAAADYIRLVTKKVGYKRKVRNEIRDELIAHFEDALAQFTDPAEREQKAKDLIAEFGDPKLVATLARRAKKRCRPTWVKTMIRSFQILLLACAAFIIWFLTGSPKIQVDYLARLNEIVKPIPDESLNAAPFYHQAVKLITLEPNELKKTHHRYSQLDPNLQIIAQNWVNENQKAMDIMRQGFSKPYLWENYSEPNNVVLNISMPNLSKYRSFAYLFRYEAMISAQQGNFDKAADDLIGMFKLGRQQKGDKTFVEQLVGIAIQAVSMGTARDIASTYDLPQPVLHKLKNEFEAIAAPDPYRVSYKAERMFMEDEIQRSFTDGLLGSHLYMKHVVKLVEMTNSRGDNWMPLFIVGRPSMLYHPGKETTKAQLEKAAWLMDEMFALSPGQIYAKKLDYDSQVRSLAGNNYFLQFLMPAVAKVNEMSYRCKMEYQATDTILALLIYKQQKGQYPAQLEELLKEDYIKDLPQDSFGTGPLIYKRTADSFILYSIGLNYTDDGGKIEKDKDSKPQMWSNKADTVFWPVSK